MRKYDLTVNDQSFNVRVDEFTGEEAELEVNGQKYNVTINKITQETSKAAGTAPVRSVSSSAPVTAPETPAGDQVGSVKAPIPGVMMDIYVKVGDSVKAGQPLFKMEAMKMENEINARVDGEVKSVNAQVGDTVNQGQELMLIAPSALLKNRRQSD